MKLICTECRWRGTDGEMLTAPNPFSEADTITGCPRCKSVDTLVEACDEPGCWRESSCGTPTLGDYRRTCGEHVPKCTLPPPGWRCTRGPGHEGPCAAWPT